MNQYLSNAVLASAFCSFIKAEFSTFYPLAQSVELLHGAAVTLLALRLCILLHGRHGERLLQGQHDFIHLDKSRKKRKKESSFSSNRPKINSLTLLQKCSDVENKAVFISDAKRSTAHSLLLFVFSLFIIPLLTSSF